MHTRIGLRVFCRGVVQGVGFRPAVSRLAASLALEGRITNVDGAVRLELVGSRPALELFLRRLEGVLPAAARLEPLRSEWLDPPLPRELASVTGLRMDAAPAVPLAEGWYAPSLVADRAPCASCLAELDDPADRRHGYPFISCAQCGPRWSIATAAPWCRAHTTLAPFPLCRECRREFEQPADRRFHAETIACPRCGPRLSLHLARPSFTICSDADPLQRAAALLRSGGILALQGVGGFQLLVLATDQAAVARLRRRKRRAGKPLALLVESLSDLEPLLQVDQAEREALHHPAAPIVLLRRRSGSDGALIGVAPGSPCLGVMLPASPLHLLLARAVGAPLVCTSGNRSGESLCIEASEAMQRLEGIADGVLHHDRAIARPSDDSLLQLVRGHPTLLRRARGYAPEPLRLAPMPGSRPADTLLALGGDLKSAPALGVGNQVWLAPHLGDLRDARVQGRWRAGLEDLLRRAPAPVQAVLCDGHPGYLSHQAAGSLARPVQSVPHHLAHGLAVVVEHGLQPPVLLVAFDGLGYGGPPGPGPTEAGAAVAVAEPLPQLRGGEVLLLEPGDGSGWRASTAASLLPFPLPGGVAAMREPRRSALGLLQRAGGLEHPGAWRLRRAFPPEDRRLLEMALRTSGLFPMCSSAGRLFDGAAALLGLVQVLRHEGEGGMRLQAAAQQGLPLLDACVPELLPLLPVPEAGRWWLDWRPLLLELLNRSAPGADRACAAAWFHLALAEGLAASLQALLVGLPCQHEPRPRPGHPAFGPAAVPIVLSGGCFQNALLLEATLGALERRHLVGHWSQAVPCNDGGLALGQIAAARCLAA
ncbi:MAG: carbamoyltransferase HypF [Synechococcus sp. ELA057]